MLLSYMLIVNIIIFHICESFTQTTFNWFKKLQNMISKFSLQNYSLLQKEILKSKNLLVQSHTCHSDTKFNHFRFRYAIIYSYNKYSNIYSYTAYN